MTKTLLDKTVASAIQGNDVSSMNRFGENCKTAKDWKKLEQRCYRKGWMYKLVVTGELPSAACDPFSLFAAHTRKEAIDFAFGVATFWHSCLDADDIPDYVFPFKLYSYDKLTNYAQLVYQYESKTPMPDWGVYKLIVPEDPYKSFWYLYYSKNEQTAIKEAHDHVRRRMIKFVGWDTVPDSYAPHSYHVLFNDNIIYEYTPSSDVYLDSKYLVTSLFDR
jgi:hypothetical protein